MATQIKIRQVLRIALTLLILHLLAGRAALAQQENASSAFGTSSMIVASDSPLAAYRGFVYAIAEDHKHLLRKPVAAGSWLVFETNTNFSDIRGLTSVNPSTFPLKDTNSESFLGNLYVADASNNSIYRIGIDNPTSELLYHGDSIRSPEEISVSGHTLFISTSRNTLFVFDLDQKTLSPLDIGDAIPSQGHVHLAASGNVLLVSNSLAGVLFSVANPLWPKQAVRTDYLCQQSSPRCKLKQSGLLLPAVLPPADKAAALQHPGPIGLGGGVIYSVDSVNKQVFASSQHTLRPIRLYSRDHKVADPSSILLTETKIILLDSGTRDIAVWPLLTPTEIVVDVKTSESLSAIYNYLYRQGLLPTKVTPLKSSIEKTLRDQGALLSPYVTSLNPVMCGLNPSICQKGRIKQNLAFGIALTIPDLYSEDYIDLRQVTLDGSHTLDYEVDHGIRNEAFDAWKGEGKLRQLNPQYRGGLFDPIKLKRKGTFTVPVELVRYLVAVPQNDLASQNSELAQIQGRYSNDLTVYSLREIKTTVQQDPSIQQYLVGLDATSFEAAYAKLRETINFRHPTPLTSHPISYIGVADELIDCDNPDIADVCSMPVNEITTTPQSLTRTPPAVPATFRIFQKTDHGTAIAGLLAARHTVYTGIGLVAPEGYVVPLISKEPPLADEIKSAVLQTGAQVFNLSFAFDEGPPPQKIADEITLGTSDTLVNAIFIVAAPDDGKPVCGGTISYPICWANQPNVIGVAATLLDGSELIPNDAGPAWGKEYVQIAAPGIGFGAPGLNGNYVPVAGTSFAAPLVSATAALLTEQGVTDPRLIKQRIIATTTVKGAYKDKVKGGLLNVDRAVSHVAEGVLVDANGKEKVVQLVRGGKIYITSGKGNFSIDLKNVLRLTQQRDGTYRIIFQDQYDPSKLEVWDGVSFSTTLRWKIKYRIAATPGAPLGPQVSDDLADYADYFGPILN